MKNASGVSTKKNQVSYTLPEDDRKAEYVKQNFNEISQNYDLFNDAITFGLHRLWKNTVITETGLRGKSGRLLDLCSGTGDLALMASRALGTDSEVTALDFSPEMLEVLRLRLQTHPDDYGVVHVLEGDATDLTVFENDTFDAITIGFGLRNVTDRAKTFSEMLRVLRPGGRAVILDVGKVPYSIPRYFHRIFFEKIVPLIGHIIHGTKHEMYDYLPASSKVYPDQETLKKEMETAGFHSVRYKNFFLGAAAMHSGEKPGG